MHIVILNDLLPADSPGGASQAAWRLGHGLLAEGHRVTFVGTTRGKAHETTLQGIPMHVLHSHYAHYWQAWFGLLNPLTVVPLNRLLRKLQPDIVHAHNVDYHLGYHSLVIGRYAQAATVFTAHNTMTFAYNNLVRFIDPALPERLDSFDYRLPFGYNMRQVGLRWNPARNLSIRHTMRYYTDMRVAVSHEMKRALEANRLPAFEVVHNGIDLAHYDISDAASEALRQRYTLQGRRVILFGGTLSRLKGDQQLFAALRRVKHAVPNVALLMLTQSDDYANRVRANNPDLADIIVMGGWLEDSELATAYRMAHVVASPSVMFEPFQMINLESMAAGTPVVTTCFGGPKEIVVDGETGFVVNPFNTDALADRLTRLLTDNDLRRCMGEASRRRVADQFTLKHQVDAMLDIYHRALERRRQMRGSHADRRSHPDNTLMPGD